MKADRQTSQIRLTFQSTNLFSTIQMSFCRDSLSSILHFSSSSVNLKLNLDAGTDLFTKGFLVGGGPPPDGPPDKKTADTPEDLKTFGQLRSLPAGTEADLTSKIEETTQKVTYNFKASMTYVKQQMGYVQKNDKVSQNN